MTPQLPGLADARGRDHPGVEGQLPRPYAVVIDTPHGKQFFTRARSRLDAYRVARRLRAFGWRVSVVRTEWTP